MSFFSRELNGERCHRVSVTTFLQQETIFGSFPRTAVSFWMQWWKLRKHEAFVEDCYYIIVFYPFCLTQLSMFNGIHTRLKALVAPSKQALQMQTPIV